MATQGIAVSPLLMLMLLLLILLMVSDQGRSDFVQDEEDLRRALLSNYSRKVRPRFKTHVTLSMVLSSLNHLRFAGQTMSINYVLYAVWNDQRLRWNSSDFGGLESLVTAPEDIWTPPLVIENSVDDVGVVGGKDRDATPVTISCEGKVDWLPPSEVTVTCEMSISYFPFDTQSCSIMVVGSTYPLSEMDLDFGFMHTSLFSSHGEFELVNFTMFTRDMGVKDDSPMYRRVFFRVSFRRKWMFYALNLILPIFLIGKLMNGVYLLPLETGEKQSYSLTVLLSYIVFLTWVSDILPPVSTDISILQVYLVSNLILGSLQSGLTIWIVRLYHQPTDRPLSTMYRTLATRLLLPLMETLCCWKRAAAEEQEKAGHSPRREKNSERSNSRTERQSDSSGRGRGGVFMGLQDVKEEDANGPETKSGTGHPKLTDTSIPTTISTINSTTNIITTNTSTTTTTTTKPASPLTWQEFAAMMDCVFVCVFGVVMIVMEATVFTIMYVNY